MGIEGGSNSEVQNQEINQANNEQNEINQAEHQRSGEELEGNSTIDNEGERKQIEGKDDATESAEDESSQLDKEDNIEDDPNTEQSPESDNVAPEQQLDNQDTIESDPSGADEMGEDNNETVDSLDNDDEIEDSEDLDDNQDSTEGDIQDSLDTEDSIESDDSDDSVEEDDNNEQDPLDSEDSIEDDGEESESPEGEEDTKNPKDNEESESPEGEEKIENSENGEAPKKLKETDDVENYGNKIKESFSGDAREAQKEFNDYMRDNVWNDSTLSNEDKVNIMKENFDNMTPEQQENFNVIGDARIISNPDYSDWEEGKSEDYWPDVDWPEFPGLDGDSETNPPSGVIDVDTTEVKIPEHLDRIGSPYGQNLGVVEDGHHCSQDERSIAYIENPNARNDYSFEGANYKEAIDAIKDFDLDHPEESIDRLNSVIEKNNALNGGNKPLLDSKHDDDIGKVLNMQDSYNKFQNDCKPFCEKYDVDSTYGLMGEAKEWSINGEKVCNGGAGQINTPINVDSLERLGILKNNGGW